MLSQMRERNFIKIVLWAVVISFVATMVFVWGADFQGIGCSGQPQAPQGSQWVAMVGDVGIGIREFDGRYRQAIGELSQSRQAGQAITEDERLRVLDQVFEQVVNETLFQQEVDRLGLRPTDEEVLEVLQTDPPDFLRRQFVDETGVFNMDAYQRALNDPRINWIPIEEAVRQTLPFNRLQQIFASQVHVSEGELVAEYEKRNTVCSVFYAGAGWRDMELAEGQPDSSALRAYYESHRDDYMEPERYRIAYVEIPRKASPEDEAFVLGRVEFIREELAAGRSFEDLARDYSEDPGSAENGGDLGWFGRGRMVPEFTEASFSLPVGEISEPVRTDFGYHLIKKDDERLGEQGDTEVKVRHILLSVEPSYATMDSLTVLADTLSTLGTELGSLAEAGTRFGLEVGQPKPFSLSEQVEGLGFNSAVRVMADRLEPGEVSRPFMGRDASYVIQLLEDIPEAPAEMAGLPLLSRDCERDMKQDVARAKAEELRAALDRGLSLRAACEETGLELRESTELKYQDYLPGVGAETALHLLALNMDVGTVSPVVETPQGHWVVELASRHDPDPTAFPDQRDAILQEKLGQAQQQLFESWIENLRESYGVQDFRDQFYR